MNECLDLIGDATLTAGTGDITPTGLPIPGSRPLATHTPGATITYRIANADLSQFEVGSGLWNGTALERRTVYVSSNGNDLVDFNPGYKAMSTVLSARDYVQAITAAPTMRSFIFATPALEWRVEHNQGTKSFIAYIKDSDGVTMLAATEVLNDYVFVVHLTCAMSGRVDVLFGAG